MTPSELIKAKAMDPNFRAVPGETPFAKQSRADEGRQVSGSLVLWVAAIAVLIGLNFASWSFCMWVFGQPEYPLNYKLLTKLDQIEPIQGFLPVTAPRGRFHAVKDLYALVYPFDNREMRVYNGILKRHYLRNYHERDDAVFVAGEFIVEYARPLEHGEAFSAGWVVRARSQEFPDAVVELVLPSEEPPEQFDLPPGSSIQIPQAGMCAVLLHVDRSEEPTMVFTAVPLVTLAQGATAQEPSVPKVFEFEEGASIAVTAQETIGLDPVKWPITGRGDAPNLFAGEALPEIVEGAEGENPEDRLVEPAPEAP